MRTFDLIHDHLSLFILGPLITKTQPIGPLSVFIEEIHDGCFIIGITDQERCS